MAKVTLEFDAVEEAHEIRDALDGWKWKMAMWDLDQELRSTLKYQDDLSPELDQAYESLRKKIREILDNHNLHLE
jgi:hypothetical protein